MKRKTKKKLIVGIILYTVLLGTILGVSFAWFINNREVTVKSSDDMVITVSSKLEIKMLNDGGSGEWGSVASKTLDKTYPDISGNGVDFFFPISLNESDDPFFSDPTSFLYVNEAKNPEYYCLTARMVLRTGSPMDVYLANDSSVTGENMEEKDDLTKSVSSDVIAGAVRVAFYEETTVTAADGSPSTSEQLRCIWIPNDRYEITAEGNKYVFTEEGSREAYCYLAPDNGSFDENTTEMVEIPWSAEQYASGLVLVGNDRLAQDPDAQGKAALSATNGSTSLLRFHCENGVEEKVLTVRIWVEGTDREAISTLNGGRIQYCLNLIGIEKESYSSEEQEEFEALSADASVGLLKAGNASVTSGELDYSFNGIDWEMFLGNDEEFLTKLNEQGRVFVRMPETRDKKASSVREIRPS